MPQTVAPPCAEMMTGATRLFGLLGSPVAPLKSPGLLTRQWRERGIDAVMLPFDVSPNNADLAVAGLKALSNLEGIGVTMPHKQAAVRWCDTMTIRAQRAASVSQMRRMPDGSWEGDALEGVVVVSALAETGFDARGRSALLIGAGGAGTSIAWGLADAGLSRLTVFDIDDARTDKLIANLRAGSDLAIERGTNTPVAQDLVINATPLGMREGDPLPVAIDAIDPSALVLEMVVEPRPTTLTQSARARGLMVVDGLNVVDQSLKVVTAYFGL